MFDGTLLQMIENLIADKTIIAGDLPGFFKIRHIEVADPPGEDLALKLKLLEGLEGDVGRIGEVASKERHRLVDLLGSPLQSLVQRFLSLIFNLQLREAELLVNIVRRVCRT